MVDLSSITAAVGALTAAKDLAKAALEVKNFNEVAPKIAGLNNELLKLQDLLFAHNAQLLEMQQKEVATAEELKQLRAAVELKSNYALHALSPGVFVYKSTGATVEHYVCQPCLDTGKRAILARHESGAAITHNCPVCRISYLEREIPVMPINYLRSSNPYG